MYNGWKNRATWNIALWRMWTRKMDAADEKRRRESIQRSSESLLKLIIIGTRKEKEA